MKEQLTLEMLCGYLPYGLNIEWEDYADYKLYSISENGFVLFEPISEQYIDFDDFELKVVKPIFRNLQTDLTKEIEHEGERFVPIEKLELTNFSIDNNWIIYDTESLPFYVIQKLLSWHFWIYDQSYFEKNIILAK